MKTVSSFLKQITELSLSRTAKNTYMVFLGNILSAFFAFLFIVILVRNISISDFGYFSALFSFLLLITDMSVFLPPLEKTKSKLLSFLKTAFFSQLFIAAAVTSIIWILSPSLSEMIFHNKKLILFLQITTVGIFCTIMAVFFQYALSARQRFLTSSFLSAFGGLARLGLLLILILFSLVTLANVVIIQTLSFLILMISALSFLGIDFLKAKAEVKNLKKLISFAYLLGIARGLTAIAGRLDVLLIISLKSAQEAGIYSIASRVISIYPLLSGSFSTVIAPKLAQVTTEIQLRNFMYKIILATLALIGTVAVMILVSHPFMILLFREKGEAAVSVFRLLLVAMVFFVGSIPAVSLTIYHLRKPHILTINSILQLVIVVIGNAILIPKFGKFGAAYSLIAAYGITLISTSILAFHYYRKKHAS